MSQHYFDTVHQGDPITVLLGWDRPLGFFMVVERREPVPGQDDCLYINLDEPDAIELDLDHFKTKLHELGIDVPRTMFEQVASDVFNGLMEAGNRVVVYAPDGSFQH